MFIDYPVNKDPLFPIEYCERATPENNENHKLGSSFFINIYCKPQFLDAITTLEHRNMVHPALHIACIVLKNPKRHISMKEKKRDAELD